MRAEERKTQERLDSYGYPVLTLPNEIVCEIFIHFLPVYPVCAPQTGVQSPTLLTHVCRRWREIALARTTFWKAILLTGYGGRGQAQILEAWLSRSGDLPISIDMDCISSTTSNECLEVLALHRARWAHVILAVELESSLLIVQDTLPLLQQLEIGLTARVFHSLPQGFARCLDSALSLSGISIIPPTFYLGPN